MRPDLGLVAGLVPAGSRVLDLGCGNGELLAHLAATRGCRVHGVEISDDGFHACVARGVPVTQGDIDEGLADVADESVDVVILSQTLQATRRPVLVLREMRRVGALGIVSFPNFGLLRHRLDLAFRGRMPVSRVLPNSWYATPNLHLCTISDFEELARSERLPVERRLLLDGDGREASRAARRLPNLLAAGAVYAVRWR